MQVTLVYSPAPRCVEELTLAVPEGCTLGQALLLSGWPQRFPELAGTAASQDVTPGIWGRAAGLDTVLREQDRVEFYRSLRVDPKVARRERFNKQGARTSGLFAKRRPGAKPGY
ncbi:MAG TPA: RnfH family protein [Macromonas sp.]|nr:RnfH family protein [Macromonas sp.]